jgi:integrase
VRVAVAIGCVLLSAAAAGCSSGSPTGPPSTPESTSPPGPSIPGPSTADGGGAAAAPTPPETSAVADPSIPGLGATRRDWDATHVENPAFDPGSAYGHDCTLPSYMVGPNCAPYGGVTDDHGNPPRINGYILYMHESAWRVHVEPRWAHVQISNVRFSDVQAWVSELSTRRGAVIVRFAHAVLARILADAVRDHLLVGNPARGVKLPKKPPQRNVYLTGEQLQLLAEEADRYHSLVLLLGVGGPRWGEAIALRVSDVDFLRRRIELHRNAVKVGTGFKVGTLKGNKNRTIRVPQIVIDALSRTAKGKSRDDLLWTSTTGDYLRSPDGTESWLAGAVARCQKHADEARAKESKKGDEPTTPTFPRITARDLRHTAASLAIHAGANPKVVQRMLGHTSAAMTLDVYADLWDSDLDSVADKVEDALTQQSGA